MLKVKLKLVDIISSLVQNPCPLAGLNIPKYQITSTCLMSENKEKGTVQRNAKRSLRTPLASELELGIPISQIQIHGLSRGHKSFKAAAFIEVFSFFIEPWHYHGC